MKKLFHILFLASVAVGIAAAQSGLPQLGQDYNYPCSYSWAGVSGDVSCWVGGTCQNSDWPNTPLSISASWYDDWSCSTGYVVASGEAAITYNPYYPAGSSMYVMYPVGLIVNDSSSVTAFYDGWTVNSQKIGYQGQDCQGGYQYSGPYEYNC